MFRRVTLSTLAALALVAATVVGVGAGGDVGDEEAESGYNREVTLRLTLRGPVVPTDAFVFTANFVNPASPADLDLLEGRRGLVCGPPGEFYADQALIEPCSERTYEAVFAVPVEEAAEFRFLRDEDLSDGEAGSKVLYTTIVPATATVTTAGEGDRSPQTFTVVYDYSLPLLPDTAVPTDG